MQFHLKYSGEQVTKNIIRENLLVCYETSSDDSGQAWSRFLERLWNCSSGDFPNLPEQGSEQPALASLFSLTLRRTLGHMIS